MPHWIVALPVYNEVSHVTDVLEEVARYADHLLVVDDGSSDGTDMLLKELEQRLPLTVLTHPHNLGYGAALRTAFQYAIEHEFEAIVTIDCDGQHQPQLIPKLVEALQSETEPKIDIISGSRYLQEFTTDVPAPEDRRKINFEITAQLNRQLDLNLTDTFCGFKAYRTSALEKLNITETGYAMPLQLWIQAACAQLTIQEYPVPRIYLDENRSFGGSLDDSRKRMQHYQAVISRELQRISDDCPGRSHLSATGV